MLKKLLIIAISLAVLIGGGTYAYIHFIKDPAPKELSLSDLDSTSSSSGSESSAAGGTTGSVEGSWSIAGGSVAGYRVEEVLFGQSTTAVGRTSRVTGSLNIAGTKLTTAEFSVDVATITSDETRRDNKFRGDIMDAERYPNATFTLTNPVDLGSIPADKVEITKQATGELTLKGTKRTVTFDVTARRNGAKIEVNGSIPVKFSDYNIDNPSNPVVTTQDNGKVEFLLVFSK